MSGAKLPVKGPQDLCLAVVVMPMLSTVDSWELRQASTMVDTTYCSTPKSVTRMPSFCTLVEAQRVSPNVMIRSLSLQHYMRLLIEYSRWGGCKIRKL